MSCWQAEGEKHIISAKLMKAERESTAAYSKCPLLSDRKWSQTRPHLAAVYPIAAGAMFLDQFNFFFPKWLLLGLGFGQTYLGSAPTSCQGINNISCDGAAVGPPEAWMDKNGDFWWIYCDPFLMCQCGGICAAHDYDYLAILILISWSDNYKSVIDIQSEIKTCYLLAFIKVVVLCCLVCHAGKSKC